MSGHLLARGGGGVSRFQDAVDVQVALQGGSRADANGLVGLEQTNGTMRVATASPFDAYPMDDLASMLEMELEPVLAPRTEITSLINKNDMTKEESKAMFSQILANSKISPI